MKPPPTPIRSQYLRIKQRYPDAIVFFRLGDFYETFDEDARLAARELDITLTSKPMGKDLRVPLAGIPYHALQSYLAKLIGRGYKVAICEQQGETRLASGLMEREVVRVVTPGTVEEPALLAGAANNYLAALVWEGDEAGLAFVDITTGEFAATQLPGTNVSAELERLRPAELLVADPEALPQGWRIGAVTGADAAWFEGETAAEALKTHFATATLDAFGVAHLPLAVGAAGALLAYVRYAQRGALKALTRLSTYSVDSFMTLDAHTRRNLELLPAAREDPRPTLLSVLDLTRTPMGGRLLRRWIGQPLRGREAIERRLDGIAALHESALVRARLDALLAKMGDLERLANRVRAGSGSPREVVALRLGLERVPEVAQALQGAGGGELSSVTAALSPCEDVCALIAQALVDDPPVAIGQGDTVRTGFSPELDDLRAASRNARLYLADLERAERERTGVKSLRVGYNKVFGYYIEVSNANLGQVPDEYMRKQTLVGAERFFTPQLKEYESLILNAQERIGEMEETIFRQVCQQVGAAAERILRVAGALAELDVLCALAEAAVRHGYTRPILTEGDELFVKEGRHPVVECAIEEAFVPNDTRLSAEEQIVILTGPNMSGKSTYLRQVALIVLMAQMGSFVPAAEARIGLVDRIFTRIGAQDDISGGRSTFMVEMIETANILHNATLRSLIVLDEIGRGTSTYDGISIARAVAEYIHNHPQVRSRTLFATHYHELVDLSRTLPRVKNYNVAVLEQDGQVRFLRKIVPGGADRSYGIHVGQLAGLPAPVVARAQEILAGLEQTRANGRPRAARKERAEQLALLATPPDWLRELSDLDLDTMTPIQALNRLYELQRRLADGTP